MSAPNRKNAIVRRLDQLADQWVEFAEMPDARLLCWQLAADETSMLDAFFAVETSAEAGTLPDLFVRLGAPFDPAVAYGLALSAEFAAQAKSLEAGLESRPTPPWVAPAQRREESDVALWSRTCAAFIEHFNLPGHLAVWVDPSDVRDVVGLQLWLQRALAEASPKLRFIIVDSAEAPALAWLGNAEPKRVVVRVARLDMARARLEISEQAGGLDTPGGKYRHAYVKMSNALGSGQLAQAEAHGDEALAVAEQQRWFALAVPVHFALAVGLAGASQGEQAHERYLRAELAAAAGEGAGEAACARLRVQARMARGGLLVGLRSYGAAATLFVETLPLARALGDAPMLLDGYRLAAFSFEQHGDHSSAWRYGTEGLLYAREVDRATLETSTFAYLGDALMRLSERAEFAGAGQRIAREMGDLLGRADWRPGAAHASQPVAPPPAGAA